MSFSGFGNRSSKTTPYPPTQSQPLKLKARSWSWLIRWAFSSLSTSLVKAPLFSIVHEGTIKPLSVLIQLCRWSRSHLLKPELNFPCHSSFLQPWISIAEEFLHHLRHQPPERSSHILSDCSLALYPPKLLASSLVEHHHTKLQLAPWLVPSARSWFPAPFVKST